MTEELDSFSIDDQVKSNSLVYLPHSWNENKHGEVRNFPTYNATILQDALSLFSAQNIADDPKSFERNIFTKNKVENMGSKRECEKLEKYYTEKEEIEVHE